jgi:transposase
MARPRTNKVLLTEEQIETVKKTLKSRKTCETIKSRCRVLLDMGTKDGNAYTDELIASRNGVSKRTVRTIITTFTREGLESVLSMKRSINSDNSNRKVDGRAEARLVDLATGPVPEGHARWTLRLLAEESKLVLEAPVGKDAIARALKKTGFDLTKTSIGASPEKETLNS